MRASPRALVAERVIVCDTGPLVAAAISDDRHHGACVDPFNASHRGGRRILVPSPSRKSATCLGAKAGRPSRRSS
jgi:hypothetical protein